jgi:hypothetical protein
VTRECIQNYSGSNKAKYYRKKHNSVAVHARQVVNMQKSDIFSVVFLCIINIVFMVAGIFLNSVVIISLWRSSQLRKKLCYFMIFVLSCFDLAVVTITHPLLIMSTISVPLGEINEICERTRISIYFVVCNSSMFALFTLNVKRFLALTCPFFHQASVTKTRFLYFQAFLTVIIVGLSPLVYFYSDTFGNRLSTVIVLSLLFFFIYSCNYKTFKIAKSKREDESDVPSAATSMDGNRKKRIFNLKNISICSLSTSCFYFCSCPEIIHSVLRLASEGCLRCNFCFFICGQAHLSL